MKYVIISIYLSIRVYKLLGYFGRYLICLLKVKPIEKSKTHPKLPYPTLPYPTQPHQTQPYPYPYPYPHIPQHHPYPHLQQHLQRHYIPTVPLLKLCPRGGSRIFGSGVHFGWGGFDLCSLTNFSWNSLWKWNNLGSRGGSFEPPEPPLDPTLRFNITLNNPLPYPHLHQHPIPHTPIPTLSYPYWNFAETTHGRNDPPQKLAETTQLKWPRAVTTRIPPILPL